MRQYPSDALGELPSIVGLGQVARTLVLDDVRKTAGIEGDHRGGAGVGLDAGVGQVVLARWQYQCVGGTVDGAQAEVVVQVAGVMDGEAERGWLTRGKLTEDHQFQAGDLAAQMADRIGQQVETLARVSPTAHGAEQQ